MDGDMASGSLLVYAEDPNVEDVDMDSEACEVRSSSFLSPYSC